MKLGVAQHNAKFMTGPTLIFLLCLQFAEKESFHHVVLNNLRGNPWTALITCANFSLETSVYNQNDKEVF